jgi:hypothetical protein
MEIETGGVARRLLPFHEIYRTIRIKPIQNKRNIGRRGN